MIKRRPLYNPAYSFDIRLRYLALGLFLFSGLLVYRLAVLQILGGRALAALASRQHSTVRVLPAERGKILYGERKSAELYPLATSRVYNHIYAIPRDVTNASSTLAALWPWLSATGVSEETLLARLEKENDIYEPLAHKLTDQETASILALKLPGIGAEPETWRFYPERAAAAQVVGFVGGSEAERTGQYGLERFLDDELKGQDGVIEGDVDVTGRLIQTGSLRRVEPQPGTDVVLTLDRVVQAFACDKLKIKAQALGADGGDLIIMEPTTGAIAAMCTQPDFDPNDYGQVKDISVYMNSAISAPYEPGSVFKPITMAAAMDDNKVAPATTYTDTGEVRFGSFTIRNSDNLAHGLTTMVGVLEKSLNTGAIFAEQQIGNSTFRRYVEDFNFGQITGIDLASEGGGNIKSLYDNRDIYFATASFGQGITVTPLQLVAAYGALANGGKIMRPYVIKEKIRANAVAETTQPTFVGQPVSLRTATMVSGMLVSVVREGHAKRAGVAGYRIGAKTGTAQVAEAGEYGDKTMHTVVGYGPIDKPAFVMLVKMNNPKAGRFAESTVVPVFGEVAKFLLQYYEIAPDEEVN